MKREDWLAIRNTPSRDPRPPRFLHISTRYQWVRDTTLPYFMAEFKKVDKGRTYRRETGANVYPKELVKEVLMRRGKSRFGRLTSRALAVAKKVLDKASP